jgi:hypothetical protein
MPTKFDHHGWWAGNHRKSSDWRGSVQSQSATQFFFGRKQIEIISRKLPESTKTYLKRHNECLNDELKLNAKTLALTQAFKSNAAAAPAAEILHFHI